MAGKIGRPPLPPEERKTRNLSFRVRDALRDKIQRAAEENGRTISGEAEFRLEQSFIEDRAGFASRFSISCSRSSIPCTTPTTSRG